jgi:hypothetical protein
MRTLFRSGLLAAACAASASAASAQTTPVVAAPPADSVTAAAPAPATAPAAPARPSERSTSNRLVAADINDAPFTNVYDLVRARRPRWLRVRMVGAQGQTETVRLVVNNGAPMSVQELKNIAPADVERMEFRDAFDVSGSGSGQTYAGTILVVLKR